MSSLVTRASGFARNSAADLDDANDERRETMSRETFAGTCAGVVGTLVGFPFDTVKTRMQAAPERFPTMPAAFSRIAAREGLSGFFRGVAAPLGALTVLNSLNFGLYSQARAALGVPAGALDLGAGPDVRVALAGMLGGPFASAISTPFEYVKIQAQLHGAGGGGGAARAARDIIARSASRGPAALFVGHGVNTARECVFLGTYFGAFEHGKAALLGGAAGPALAEALTAVPVAGGFAGALGWLVSFPLDCVKARVQGHDRRAAAGAGSHPPPRALAAARALYAERGLRGLYAGVAPSVARAFLVSSTRFSVYESALVLIDRIR